MDLFEFAIIVIGETIAFVVWLVRLEGRINHLEKINQTQSDEIHSLRIRYEALDSKIVEKLGEVEKSLARIEGRLEAKRESGQ